MDVVEKRISRQREEVLIVAKAHRCTKGKQVRDIMGVSSAYLSILFNQDNTLIEVFTKNIILRVELVLKAKNPTTEIEIAELAGISLNTLKRHFDKDSYKGILKSNKRNKVKSRLPELLKTLEDNSNIQTLEDLAGGMGISMERVRQLIRKYDPDKKVMATFDQRKYKVRMRKHNKLLKGFLQNNPDWRLNLIGSKPDNGLFNVVSNCGLVKFTLKQGKQKPSTLDYRLLELYQSPHNYKVSTEFYDLHTNTGGEACSRIYCPECSNDEFVKVGLCDGVFTATTRNIKNGVISCRCSTRHKYTQEQREYQIKIAMEVRSGKFLGWEDNTYTNVLSNVNWICSEGHTTKTPVGALVNLNIGCNICWKEKQKEQGFCNGYYKDRTQESDNLYVIDFGTCIKVGRAFDIDKRIGTKSTGLLNVSGRDREDVKILANLQDTHENIYRLEQNIHEELRDRGFEFNAESWSTEIFDKEAKKLIYRLLDESGCDFELVLENNLDMIGL